MEPSPKRMTPMAHSSPLNDVELNMAAGLLGRAVSFGQQQVLAKKAFQSIGGKSLAAPSQCFLEGIQKEVQGTMSDSPKRQRDVDSEWGVLAERSAEDCAACALEQMDQPLPSYSAGYATGGTPMPGRDYALISKFGENTKIPLPNDIASAVEWSRTELKLQKVAHMNITYAEFLAKARVIQI